MFAQLPCAALILEPDLTILQANPLAADMFGDRIDKENKIPLGHLLADGGRKEILNRFPSSNQPVSLETHVTNSVNKLIPVTLKVSRLENNNFLLLIDEKTGPATECGLECSDLRILQVQYKHNPAGILLVNEQLEMLSYNDEFIRMWAIPPYVQESKDDNKSLQAILSQVKEPERFLEKVYYVYENHGEVVTDEVDLKDGRCFYRHSYPIIHQDRYFGRVWYFLDITELKKAQDNILLNQKFQEAILEHIHDGILACDADGNLTLFNRATKALHGGDIEAMPIRRWAEKYRLFKPDGTTPLALEEVPLFQAKQGKTVRNREVIFKCAKGGDKVLRVNGQAMYDDHGQQLGAVVTLHDITDLTRIKTQLHHMAHHDPLTSLPNRRLFHDLLEQCIRRAKRDNNQVGVLFLDLDNFKLFNDTFGHGAGDQLLVNLASYLQQCLRESDLICRWGGDEFVIALPGIQVLEDASQVAEKICRTVQEKFSKYQSQCKVTISIGISLFPDHGLFSDKLIRKADMAMYDAKQAGSNRFCWVNQALSE